jgi:hypothetical protein
MGDVFTAAKKQYYDNYLQYKLTNQSNYKTAYEGALKSMNNSVSALQQQVDSFSRNTASTSPQPPKSRMFMEAEERKKEAQLRGVVPPVSTPPTPSMEWRYITIGGMVGITLLLMSL